MNKTRCDYCGKEFYSPYDKIRCAKPLFKMYIGDEAFRFHGDWAADMPRIKQILGERANP